MNVSSTAGALVTLGKRPSKRSPTRASAPRKIEPVPRRWRKEITPSGSASYFIGNTAKRVGTHGSKQSTRTHDPAHQPGRHPSGRFQATPRTQTFHLPMALGRKPLRYLSLRLPPTSPVGRRECAVQDQAAQHAAHLIISALRQKNPNASPIKVLDACAAPGGKLFHVREALTQEHIAHYLFALDNKATRLQELSEIATRLGHATHAHADGSTPRTESIGLICADGCATDLPFPDPFDVILIDAPCSGSGTIRRNPDIRMLLSQKVLLEHQVLQRQLLQNLWQRLMPGGTLVYSTCSVFSEENDQVIQSFLGSTADALVVAQASQRAEQLSMAGSYCPQSHSPMASTIACWKKAGMTQRQIHRENTDSWRGSSGWHIG